MPGEKPRRNKQQGFGAFSFSFFFLLAPCRIRTSRPSPPRLFFPLLLGCRVGTFAWLVTHVRRKQIWAGDPRSLINWESSVNAPVPVERIAFKYVHGCWLHFICSKSKRGQCERCVKAFLSQPPRRLLLRQRENTKAAACGRFALYCFEFQLAQLISSFLEC